MTTWHNLHEDEPCDPRVHAGLDLALFALEDHERFMASIPAGQRSGARLYNVITLGPGAGQGEWVFTCARLRALPNLEHPVRTVGIVHRPPDHRGLRVDVYEAGSA